MPRAQRSVSLFPAQDILVFDEESDRHVIIPWEDAVGASFCLPTGDGGVRTTAVVRAGAGLQSALAAYQTNNVPVNGVAGGGDMIPPVSDNLTAGEWRDLANCWRMINKYGAGAEAKFPKDDDECALQTGGTGVLGTDSFTISNRFRGRSIKAFMQVPEFRVYCVVARPFIEHVMQSAIMAVSGRDTGAMLFGPSDMCAPVFTPSPQTVATLCKYHLVCIRCIRLQANLRQYAGQDHRRNSGYHVSDVLPSPRVCSHYTGHFKAVINKPQNVFVMRDIACASYVAGMNTQFFGHKAGEKIQRRYTASLARSQIMRRLAFADEVGAKYKSCMSFAVSAAEYEDGGLDTVMSVTTRLLPWEVNTSGTHDSFPGGDEMFNEYNRVLNLKQIHYGEDVRAAENMEFISQVSLSFAFVATLFYRGHSDVCSQPSFRGGPHSEEVTCSVHCSVTKMTQPPAKATEQVIKV
eukprot:1134161-Prymnesium_polylepis.3